MVKKNECNFGDESSDTIFAIAFMMIVILGMGFVIGYINGLEPEPKEHMGSAICDQEYGLDYDFYSYETGLHCKNKTIEKQIENYDGLIVNLDT